ncbi:hypothetical protein TNIN_49661 [Trichonephila inaurata madagascariensis]|uniref:Uncharacterized protein n=1 Tax=Trichonephila inaurata madagascariensis TaxID=2747483 RepID=A0A8X7BS99_9ARAC|nr:hypothetical protein TNIN_49661 [Trichonephila inaurata madagascariensis]
MIAYFPVSISEFVPLIDGANPIPDTNLKASSSISPNSGPNAARFNKKGFKAWGVKLDDNQAEEKDLEVISVSRKIFKIS